MSPLLTQENVGKYVLVRTEPQKLYLITKRANGGLIAVPIGNFPEVVEGPKGDKGDKGEQGDNGTKVGASSGTTLPSPDSYKEGDLFILGNGMLYKLVQGKWYAQCDLKGPQGLRGPQGTAVTANPVEEPSDVLTKVKIDGITYDIQEITTEKLSRVLEGSETVVVDENLEGDKLQVRLDQDVTNKLDRALVTPLTTPTEKMIVGVGTGNEQVMYKIGDGLEIVGSTSPYTIQKKEHSYELILENTLTEAVRTISQQVTKNYKKIIIKIKNASADLPGFAYPSLNGVVVNIESYSTSHRNYYALINLDNNYINAMGAVWGSSDLSDKRMLINTQIKFFENQLYSLSMSGGIADYPVGTEIKIYGAE